MAVNLDWAQSNTGEGHDLISAAILADSDDTILNFESPSRKEEFCPKPLCSRSDLTISRSICKKSEEINVSKTTVACLIKSTTLTCKSLSEVVKC